MDAEKWAQIPDGVTEVEPYSENWRGDGNCQAVRTFDYPVLMGILVITALVVVLANLLADILYAVVDPRISYG